MIKADFDVIVKARCILPFSECPYRQGDGNCEWPMTCAANSDAGCRIIPARKRREMLIGAINKSNVEFSRV